MIICLNFSIANNTSPIVIDSCWRPGLAIQNQRDIQRVKKYKFNFQIKTHDFRSIHWYKFFANWRTKHLASNHWHHTLLAALPDSINNCAYRYIFFKSEIIFSIRFIRSSIQSLRSGIDWSPWAVVKVSRFLRLLREQTIWTLRSERIVRSRDQIVSASESNEIRNCEIIELGIWDKVRFLRAAALVLISVSAGSIHGNSRIEYKYNNFDCHVDYIRSDWKWNAMSTSTQKESEPGRICPTIWLTANPH